MDIMDNNKKYLCVAGTHSGCGKTTVSLGIMAALVKRGLIVQPFKVGPDFIDPGHHRRITGRDSHNLDGWMMTPEYNRRILARYSRDSDWSVVEGVMGVFDGFSGRDETGSTAQMAKWLNLPTVIVIDAGAMARSAAAVALGFSMFDPELPLKGIIFNRVGSKKHARMINDAVSFLPDLTVLGYLPREKGLEIPSRHLGLVTDEDFSADKNHIERLANWIEDNIEIEKLLKNKEPRFPCIINVIENKGPHQRKIRIGIARDEAFCFYYPENLRLLREAGAELIPFSPLRDNRLPQGIKGLILGGGYPELHCSALSRNRELLGEIKGFGMSGRPVYAECGGFMYLVKEIRDLKGDLYPMVGIFPMKAEMVTGLHALGYREIITRKESMLGPAGTKIRGHEFHYSRIKPAQEGAKKDGFSDFLYSMTDRMAVHDTREGFIRENVLGSYIHLHLGSNPEVAVDFVGFCRRYGGWNAN